MKHDKAGIVGMVNKGPHTNASQFYITLAALPWMDGKSVGIGYVVDGLRALRILEQVRSGVTKVSLARTERRYKSVTREDREALAVLQKSYEGYIRVGLGLWVWVGPGLGRSRSMSLGRSRSDRYKEMLCRRLSP